MHETAGDRSPLCSLLLLDMMLGDMTGRDVLQRLHELGVCLRSMRIIIVSADELKPAVEGELRSLGVHSFWMKPVEKQTVDDLGILPPAQVPDDRRRDERRLQHPQSSLSGSRLS